MGVHPGVHFVAWFLENVFVLTLSSCALTVILKASSIFAYSDGFLVFLLFLDFGVSITMLSYLLSACFSTSNTAALCASLVYMISFLPYIIILVLQNQLTIVHQILVVRIPFTTVHLSKTKSALESLSYSFISLDFPTSAIIV